MSTLINYTPNSGDIRTLKAAYEGHGSLKQLGDMITLPVCPWCGGSHTLMVNARTGRVHCSNGRCRESLGNYITLSRKLGIPVNDDVVQAQMRDMSTEQLLAAINDSRPSRSGSSLITDVGWEVDDDVESFSTGLPSVDKLIGGLRMGTYNVLAGVTSHGKSTWAANIAVQAISQGYPVWYYSGEASDKSFKSSIATIVGGPTHVVESVTEYGNSVYSLDPACRADVDAIAGDMITVYTDQYDDQGRPYDIMDVMERDYRALGCRVFIVDNLMMVCAQHVDKEYAYQAQFCQFLVNFCKRNNVCVILCCHPRKTPNGVEIQRINGISDIYGSGMISNLAHCVMVYERTPDGSEHPRAVRVLKNRTYGVLETGGYYVDYNKGSRRIYEPDDYARAWRCVPKF